MEAQPMNTPRIKKIKMLPPIVDVGKTLADRLGGSGLPALGLEYVTEYFNPEDSRAHPMYMCSLEGCKSAWGTSDDTFHHVTNTKHLGNLLKKYCKSEGMMFKQKNKAEIQAWAVMEEEKEGGMHGPQFSLFVGEDMSSPEGRTLFWREDKGRTITQDRNSGD